MSQERGDARVVLADRKQLSLRAFDLDSTLVADHVARTLWSAVEQLDLRELYLRIRARGEQAGRPAVDPKILLCVWLYAMTRGVGSAREVERLCVSEDGYRWICGGVHVNHHTLSDFRNETDIDRLMAQLLAALMHKKLVKLDRTAHDGLRVRASAGAASFRRKKTLRECLKDAESRIVNLQGQLNQPATGSDRELAARKRAAEERHARVASALKEMPKVEALKKRNAARRGKTKKTSAARVSTTDVDARVMKMADGGFRPAYNVQLVADVESRFIVAVDVRNDGSDMALLPPMLDQLERQFGKLPTEHLVDGGFAGLVAIENAENRNVTIYAPPREAQKKKTSTHKDSPAVARWRRRMKTQVAKTIYKQRASTIETINAEMRCLRGLNCFRVRGLHKARRVAVWTAFTYNILRWCSIQARGQA